MADEVIRVLIVDDIAETRENIRKLLQFESDVEVVGAAKSGREAIQIAVDSQPDVILMDINMPDMDGIAATETIRRKLPFSQIVILSVQGDPNYMRRAMLAGARDFLTKPPTIDELISAIRRAGAMAKEEKDKTPAYAPQSAGLGKMPVGPSSLAFGKIVTIYAPKGGVGCTTIAANLAVTLHNDETPVALIDGNLQFGDVAVFFNEQGKNHVGDLAPRVDELDPEIVEDVMITHSSTGIKILAAPTRPEQAESVTGDQFSTLLDYLRKLFAYIIIDAPSTLDDITLATLDVSDLVILVSSQDIPSIRNSRMFLDLAKVLNLPEQRVVFVMNHYDKRLGISPEKVGDSFKKPVSAVIPQERKIVVPSVNRGIPFMLETRNKSQHVARAMLDLAEVVRHQLVEVEKMVAKAEATASR